jgi:hypothetical protein
MQTPAIGQTQRAAVFTTESHLGGRPGRIFAVPRLNHPAPEGAADLLATAISDFGKFDKAAARHEKNMGDNADAADAAALSSFKDEARRKISAQIAEGLSLCEKAASAIDERQRGLLAIPADPSKGAETRALWATLTDQQRDRLRGELDSGARDELLLALANHPLADTSPDALHAISLWTRRATTKHADALRDIAEQAEGVRECRAGFRSLENVIA